MVYVCAILYIPCWCENFTPVATCGSQWAAAWYLSKQWELDTCMCVCWRGRVFPSSFLHILHIIFKMHKWKKNWHVHACFLKREFEDKIVRSNRSILKAPWLEKWWVLYILTHTHHTHLDRTPGQTSPIVFPIGLPSLPCLNNLTLFLCIMPLPSLNTPSRIIYTCLWLSHSMKSCTNVLGIMLGILLILSTVPQTSSMCYGCRKLL